MEKSINQLLNEDKTWYIVSKWYPGTAPEIMSFMVGRKFRFKNIMLMYDTETNENWYDGFVQLDDNHEVFLPAFRVKPYGYKKLNVIKRLIIFIKGIIK